MQATLDISNEVLLWILDQSAMDKLSPKVKQYLSEWIAGNKKPTYHQIEQVSSATGIPFGYFFLETPPQEDLSLVNYRTIDSAELSKPSRNLIDTIESMEVIQDWLRTYMMDVFERRSYVGAMKDQKDAKQFANYVRGVLSLNGDWRSGCRSASDLFKVLRNAISNAGTTVMLSGIVGSNTHRPLDIHEFRAFAMVDEVAPLIFINATDSENGRLFSLLHEFAHICLGENSLYNEFGHVNSPLKSNEKLCNAVAAEILIPLDEFAGEWFKLSDLDKLEKVRRIARVYCCSTMVAARRALDCGYIEKRLYNTIVEETINALQDSKKKSDGGDTYKTLRSRLDRNFLTYLADSVASGRTAYTDAFRMTNTTLKTYTKLMDK